MKQAILSCALTLTLASGGSALFAAAPTAIDPPVEAFAPLPAEEAQTAILPAGSATAAAELSAAALCHPTKRRAALVALQWRPADGPASPSTPLPAAQRVEISKFREGFSTGRFEATRRLPAAAEAVAVDSPETGIHYYWRVLTLTELGWAPSAEERFEVPVCPWDEPDLSRFEAAINDDHPSQR